MKRYGTCRICARRRSFRYLTRDKTPPFHWRCTVACDPEYGLNKLLVRFEDVHRGRLKKAGKSQA